MVLLFLGVIFLLLGWQALGSSGKSDDDSSPVTSMTTTTAPTSTSTKTPANQAEVRVYNISGKEGVAGRTADQLKAAGFKVTEVTNLVVSDVSATTVYYGDAEGSGPPRMRWDRNWERPSSGASPNSPTSRPASSSSSRVEPTGHSGGSCRPARAPG
ncbi:hypothetical protein NIIDMKKI_67870 [Mycobacterium kansasii]|uniref:LytR/CpsA/Psr regulator C-terminal domain-containing protein n=1 Tax=Mycobacterium kansasii TaxID=1768 RepID=A0A7G1IKQ4_MYCKA|nr:hypothetical protein NIIDMKKI_67870 [Mycobacterium kansasii]